MTTPKGAVTIDTDEQPVNARPEKIPHLKPAFAPDGTVTAANASSISDGASAVVLAHGATDQPVRARIVGHVSHAKAPAHFATAPIPAAPALLHKIGWSLQDVDLW